MLDLISKDQEAYKRRDKKNAEALQRTGLGDDAPGGATFSGASKVVHPGLMEASIDFGARIIKEIFPANGPVREKIVGDVTAEKFKRAERKTKYMNWQFTQQMRSCRAELEQLLPQAALSGVAYLGLRWDDRRDKPEPEWIPGDEILLPYAATNFYTAERKTRILDLTEFEYYRRVKAGMYIDADLDTQAVEPEQTQAQKANAKVEGKSPSAYNEDGVRRFFEVYCWLDIEDDETTDNVERIGGSCPYILTIDENQRQPVGLYRNWEPDDEKQDEMYWIVEFPCVPWRGAYPIGLIHMIGGLSAATTGALRALLDTAHTNNSLTGLKLKGGSTGGQSLTIQPTEIKEIEGTMQNDDIRKTFMPLPFNPPSPVLFQLLGFLVDAAQGVIRTTYEDLAENNTNMPVGTTQALIEQGMTVFSAIHARMHDAMGRVLEILHRINRMYLSDNEVIEELGDLVVSRKDFEGALDIIPVSDPNIFSDVQRMAQMQMIVARSDAHPELYNALDVEKMILQRTKVPDAEKLLKEPPKPTELNAVNENVAATMGRPIVVFPEQDHEAHLNTLVQYAVNPIFGSNPIVAQTYLPTALNHMRDHLAMWYVNEVFEVASKASAAAGGQSDISKYMGKDPTINKALDDMLVTASAEVMKIAAEKFKGLPQTIAQLHQVLAQFQPQPPPDPAMAKANADIAEQKARGDADRQEQAARFQADQQQATAEHQFKLQQAAQDHAMDEKEIELKAQAEYALRMKELAAEHEARMTEIDRQAQHDDKQAMQDRDFRMLEVLGKLHRPDKIDQNGAL